MRRYILYKRTRSEMLFIMFCCHCSLITEQHSTKMLRPKPECAYDFLFDFNRNHASILYQLFVESRRFYPTQPAFRASVGGDPGRISRISLATKTRLPELSCGFICVIVYLAVFVEHRLVTDTDRHGHEAMAYTALV